MTYHNFFSCIDAFLGSKVVVEWFTLQISILVQRNYLQSAFVGKFFLLWVLVDGTQTKVSFFENSAWTLTKALCLNLMEA